MNRDVDELPPLTRLRCQTPSFKKTAGKAVAYFPHIDYDERTPPSKAEASLMCRTNGVQCPIAASCLKLGQSIKADRGIWGGRVMVDGKELHTTKEETNG